MGDRLMLSFTCEGFELVFQIKRLFAQSCQIHSQSGADGKLLNGPADLKDLVCDSLLGWAWMQEKPLILQVILVLYYRRIARCSRLFTDKTTQILFDVHELCPGFYIQAKSEALSQHCVCATYLNGYRALLNVV